MTRNEFLQELSGLVAALSQAERERALSFYNETLDDSMEEGLTEEAAVAALGDVREIAENIIAESAEKEPLPPSPPLPRQKLSPLQWTLLILGFPVWFPLMLVFFIVIFVVYILMCVVILVLWVIVLVLFAATLSFGIGALFGILGLPLFLMRGAVAAFFQLGAGLACAGFAVYSYYVALAACKGMGRLTAAFCRGTVSLIKNRFRKQKINNGGGQFEAS